MNIHLNNLQKSMLVEVKNYFKWNKELFFEDCGESILLHEMEEDDLIDLRELCSDYLLLVGFDEAYETNEKGEILENLIDKLYVD